MKLIILVIIGAGILLYRPFFNKEKNTANTAEEKQLKNTFVVSEVSFTDSALDFNSYSAGSFLLRCIIK